MVSSVPAGLPPKASMAAVRVAAVLAVMVVLAATLFEIALVYHATEQNFTYARDRAYVRLAVAEWMVQQDRWEGSTPVNPGPWAASSPLWTLLLAGLMWANVGSLAWVSFAPLLINLLAAGVLVLLVGHLIRQDVRGGWAMFWRLVLVAALTPIPVLVLGGTEHMLHVVVLLGAVALSIWAVERERGSLGPVLLAGIFLAAAVGLRYESLAAVAALVVWAWLRRRSFRMFIPVLAVVAVVAACMVQVHDATGWWLPPALWMEMEQGLGPRLLQKVSGWVVRAVQGLGSATLPLAMVMVAVGLLWARRERLISPLPDDRSRLAWLFVFIVAAVLHLSVFPTGWQFQYVAYTVPLGAVAILRSLTTPNEARAVRMNMGALRYQALILVCALPAVLVSIPPLRAIVEAPEACRRVYVQNRLAAAFLRTYFPSATVMVDEPGAVRYESGAHVVDLSGFTDMEIAQARATGEWDRKFLRRLTADARPELIILTGEAPLEDRMIPPEWREIGGWRGTAGEWRRLPVVRVFAGVDINRLDVTLALDEFSPSRSLDVEKWTAEADWRRWLPETQPAESKPAGGTQ